MNLVIVDEEHAYDERGIIYRKSKSGEWEMSEEIRKQLDDALANQDAAFEKNLLTRVPDALLKDGEQVYIRRVDGRLQWIKGNVYGGGQKWEELTPALAKDRLTKSGVGDVDDVSLEKLRDMLVAAQNPETYEIGWYQDIKGDLYQYGVSGWLGARPAKAVVDTLEYLG